MDTLQYLLKNRNNYTCVYSFVDCYWFRGVPWLILCYFLRLFILYIKWFIIVGHEDEGTRLLNGDIKHGDHEEGGDDGYQDATSIYSYPGQQVTIH